MPRSAFSTRLSTILCLLGVCLGGVEAAAADPVSSPRPPEEVRRQLASLVSDLDSRRYEVRQDAARKIEELAARPDTRDLMAEEFARQLLEPGLSFEARWRIVRWQSRLPKVSVVPPSSVSPAEIDQLVRQADDDSCAVRLGAAERLQWLSANARLAGPIMLGLKRRLAEPGISTDDYRRLDWLREQIWGGWLTGGSTGWDLPPVSQEQLGRWLDDLAGPAAKPDAVGRPSPSRQQIARQELQELLASDAEVPRVKAALEERLARTTNADAAAAFRDLMDLTRPAMVAEGWQGRRLLSCQHLLIGVPSKAPGAEKPSHFDRIDDRVAHCVSGNTLQPGDYPVGVAFPHPKLPGLMFHLVNLSTPRRKMAYAYCSKTDMTERLVAMSRRTTDRFLAERRPLGEREVWLLPGLDAREVSRFAGRYFRLVDDLLMDDDPALDDTGFSLPGGRSSLHGMICTVLAIDGTKDAVPGLLEAIQHKRVLPPTSLGPYEFPWLAALSIAARDPWHGVDDWLAGLPGRRDSLVLGRADGPELGATAARILLRRHGQSPGCFGLEVVPDSVLAALHVEGYRFGSLGGPERIQIWWKRQAEAAPGGPAGRQLP
ncbi:MAG: hypothetical protein ABR915_17905 [Thermoguttaceae bacterium]|jgi:hypothetical protein